ncbi:hypothetical protein AB0N73_08125 [Microbacterium sp. NPDC089189]|uniref:hypothetical protein n=1 Tax=Microbacterium sp. NPDC089189 TaxID=3154972 RepID=UPI00341EF364
MSKYYVNKFLFQVDRDPELLAAYASDPDALIERWEQEYGQWLGAGHRVEKTSWLAFTDQERRALRDHDYVALFEMGAHFFLVLTIYIAIYDEEYATRIGPLAFQREYAAKLSGWLGKEYPSVQV